MRFILDAPSMTGQMIALDGGQHLVWQTPDITGAQRIEMAEPRPETDMNEPFKTPQASIADHRSGVRHLFVRDMEMQMPIGIHPMEKAEAQRIIVNVDLAVSDMPVKMTDRYADVVCYQQVVERVRTLVGEGHVNLVETLAERIAAACLEDERVLSGPRAGGKARYLRGLPQRRH